MDFGNAFTGADRWLQLAVSTNGANAFSALSPRQALTAVPVALYARSASNVLGQVNASQLSGSIPATNLSGTVSLAQLPANVITNGASGVNFTGTFSGNGAGITGVDLRTANSFGAISFTTNYGTFPLAYSLDTGYSPLTVTTADVNGDGRPDLISANNSVNTLTVLTNNGSGGFAISSSPDVGNYPRSVTTADVNGDSKPDLISANFGPDTLTVLTNNGSGGFVISSSPGVGNSPSSVTTADVNGDSKPDLISANLQANTLTVLTNNGSGRFVISSSPGVGVNPQSVTTADVNGDSKPDLISANAGANTLTVLTNNGSGSFVISSSPGVGFNPYSVTTADVNGDSKPDLISANYGADTLTVLTNNGSGGFVISSSPGVGFGPFSVTTADLNGDGRPDLISADSFVATLTVLFNTGTFSGNFTGNGSGLTSISDTALSANVALLNSNQTFTGTNVFTGTFLGSAPYLKCTEEQPKGTAAGGNVAGINVRNFNVSRGNTSILGSLSGSNIVLNAGTYQCRISAPGYRVDEHQIRLRTTGGTVLLYGTSEFSDDELNPGVQSRSLAEGQFTLTNTATLQVQHNMTLVKTVNGLGLPTSAVWTDGSPVEVYAVAEFWKIK